MADIKKDNIGESWRFTLTFADFGSIAMFNAAYTSSNLSATNHFGDEAE
ncbi:hypothetical protein HUE58_05905 [Candidatus Ruthia endofausta]|uniref:Uncharacterized protein n=1 Tax=Candidatus Ruthia endofausta TaxID=2738852 RepID=A0A6N0HQG3_9GAMM|nr:hypothetical protein [Candidatus Ruthia endofausta]QKQ24629.1 hypothetical protein HUE58_05905 [Candidatus Ruthia endofausta]